MYCWRSIVCNSSVGTCFNKAIKPFIACKNELAQFIQTSKEGRTYTTVEVEKAQRTYSTCIQTFQSWDQVFSLYERLPYVEQLADRFIPQYISSCVMFEHFSIHGSNGATISQHCWNGW